MPQFVENKFWNWVITGFLVLVASALISGGKMVVDHQYRIKAVEEVSAKNAEILLEFEKTNIDQKVLDQIENNRSDVQSLNEEIIGMKKEQADFILEDSKWKANNNRLLQKIWNAIDDKSVLIEIEEEDPLTTDLE